MRVKEASRKTSNERGSQGESYFHGWLYRTFIDPALVPVRHRVRNWVPEGSSVVDVGCGTGAQLFVLSDRIERGLGVDLSRTQIDYARKQVTKQDRTHIEFLAADAMRLDSIQDGEFDIAVSSMVIHEMPLEKRLPVLNEMRRIAGQLILVDWEAHQPKLWRRIGAHAIERLAGGEHYRGFCSFTESGGIPALLEQADLTVLNEQDTSKGTIRIWLCA
jgi:SAM-dependent methyltransferase